MPVTALVESEFGALRERLRAFLPSSAHVFNTLGMITRAVDPVVLCLGPELSKSALSVHAGAAHAGGFAGGLTT